LSEEIKEMCGERCSYRVLVEKPKGKVTWKTGIDGMMRCIFRKGVE